LRNPACRKSRSYGLAGGSEIERDQILILLPEMSELQRGFVGGADAPHGAADSRNVPPGITVHLRDLAGSRRCDLVSEAARYPAGTVSLDSSLPSWERADSDRSGIVACTTALPERCRRRGIWRRPGCCTTGRKVNRAREAAQAQGPKHWAYLSAVAVIWGSPKQRGEFATTFLYCLVFFRGRFPPPKRILR
jgi:hypothetical protein